MKGLMNDFPGGMKLLKRPGSPDGPEKKGAWPKKNGGGERGVVLESKKHNTGEKRDYRRRSLSLIL